MKCENNCGNDLSGRQQRFCSDKRRKQSLRAATERLTRTDNSDKPNSDSKVGQCKHPDVYCHACKINGTCEYLKNQNSAVPGDADYSGVVVNGVFAI